MSNLFDILNFDSNEAKEDGKGEEQAGNGAQFDRQEDGSCQEEANMADKNICRGEVDDEMQSPPSYELTVEGSDSQFESSVDKISMPVQLMKSFIIPRKKRKCKELLQNVSLTSREYLRDISPIITKGYRDHTSRGRFLYEEVHLVNNEELTKEFKEKRKEMKSEGRTEKELTESHAFFSVENLEQAKEICQQGLRVSNSSSSCLGNPAMGVYVSRYSDLIHRTLMNAGAQAVLIIFKLIKGKVKAVSETPQNWNVQEPTPNFDCHVSKTANVNISNLTTQQAFDSTQIYLYEFGELDMVERPRHICPCAVVRFRYQTPPKSSVHSQQLSLTTPTRTSTSLRSPVTPPVMGSSPQATKYSPFFKNPASLEAGHYEVMNDNAYVLWSGLFHNKNKPLCNVKMLSYASPIQPVLLPSSVNLHLKMPISKLQNHLAPRIFSKGLPINTGEKEVLIDGRYYVYCEVKPINDLKGRLSRLMKYLETNRMVAVVPLVEMTELFLFPTSQLTHDLGITSPTYPMAFHGIFVSYKPSIRHIKVLGAMSTERQPGEESSMFTPVIGEPVIDSSPAKIMETRAAIAMAVDQQRQQQIRAASRAQVMPAPLPHRPTQRFPYAAFEPEEVQVATTDMWQDPMSAIRSVAQPPSGLSPSQLRPTFAVPDPLQHKQYKYTAQSPTTPPIQHSAQGTLAHYPTHLSPSPCDVTAPIPPSTHSLDSSDRAVPSSNTAQKVNISSNNSNSANTAHKSLHSNENVPSEVTSFLHKIPNIHTLSADKLNKILEQLKPALNKPSLVKPAEGDVAPVAPKQPIPPAAAAANPPTPEAVSSTKDISAPKEMQCEPSPATTVDSDKQEDVRIVVLQEEVSPSASTDSQNSKDSASEDFSLESLKPEKGVDKRKEIDIKLKEFSSRIKELQEELERNLAGKSATPSETSVDASEPDDKSLTDTTPTTTQKKETETSPMDREDNKAEGDLKSDNAQMVKKQKSGTIMGVDEMKAFLDQTCTPPRIDNADDMKNYLNARVANMAGKGLKPKKRKHPESPTLASTDEVNNDKNQKSLKQKLENFRRFESRDVLGFMKGPDISSVGRIPKKSKSLESSDDKHSDVDKLSDTQSVSNNHKVTDRPESTVLERGTTGKSAEKEAHGREQEKHGCTTDISELEEYGCTTDIREREEHGCTTSVREQEKHGCTGDSPAQEERGFTANISEKEKRGCNTDILDISIDFNEFADQPTASEEGSEKGDKTSPEKADTSKPEIDEELGHSIPSVFMHHKIVIDGSDSLRVTKMCSWKPGEKQSEPEKDKLATSIISALHSCGNFGSDSEEPDNDELIGTVVSVLHNVKDTKIANDNATERQVVRNEWSMEDDAMLNEPLGDDNSLEEESVSDGKRLVEVLRGRDAAKVSSGLPHSSSLAVSRSIHTSDVKADDVGQADPVQRSVSIVTKSSSHAADQQQESNLKSEASKPIESVKEKEGKADEINSDARRGRKLIHIRDIRQSRRFHPYGSLSQPEEKETGVQQDLNKLMQNLTSNSYASNNQNGEDSPKGDFYTKPSGSTPARFKTCDLPARFRKPGSKQTSDQVKDKTCEEESEISSVGQEEDPRKYRSKEFMDKLAMLDKTMEEDDLEEGQVIDDDDEDASATTHSPNAIPKETHGRIVQVLHEGKTMDAYTPKPVGQAIPILQELCKSNQQTTTDSKLQTSRPRGPEELSPTPCQQSKTRDTWLCNSKQDIMPKDSEFTKFKSSNSSNSCSRFGPSFSKSITSPNSSPSTTVTKPTISTLSQPTTKHGTGGDDNEQSVQGKGGENHLLNIEKMQMSPDGNVKEHDDICSVPKEQEKEEEKSKVEHKQDTLSHLQTKDEQSVLIHSSINVSRDPRLRKRQSGKTPQVTKDAHSSSKDISEMLEITEILKSSQKFEAEAKRSRIFLTKSSSDIIQSIRQKTKGDSEGQTVSKIESSNVKDAYMSLTKLCSRLTEEHGTAVQNMPSLNEGQESSDTALQQFTDDATEERIRCWLDSIDSNQKEADSQDSTRGEDSAESTNVCGSAAETNQTAPKSHLTSAKKKKKISFSQYKEKALKEQPGKEKPTTDHSGIRKGVLQPEEQEKAVRRKKVPVSLTIHLRRKNITDEGKKLPGGVTPPNSADVTHKDISCKKEKPTLKESGTLMIVEDAMAHPEDSCKPKHGDNEFWTTVGMKTAETRGSIHKDKIPFLSVLSPIKSSKSSQETEKNSDVVYLEKNSANLHKSQITCELKMSSSFQSLSNSLEDKTSNFAAVTSETDKNKSEENYQGHEGENGDEIGVYESDDKENIEIKNSDTEKEKNTRGNEEESKDEFEKEAVCQLKDAESISSKENSVIEHYSVGTSSYTKTGFDFDSKAESEGYSYDSEAQCKEKSAESKRSHRLHQLHAELGTKTDELLQTMFKCFEERYRILLDDFHVNIPAGCDSLLKSSFASANGKHLYPLSKCSLGDGVKISENTAQRFQNCVFQKSKEALQRMEKEFSKVFTPRCTVSEEDSFKRQTTETFCKAFIDLKGEIMQVLKDYGVKLHELTRGSPVDLYATNKIHYGNLSHLSRCFGKSSSKEALRCIALEEAKQRFEEEVESILNAAVPRRRKYKICDTLQEGDSTPEVGSEGTPTECDFLLQGQHGHFCDNFACGECQKSSGPITSREASSEPMSKIAISVSSSHNKFETPKQDTKATPGTQESFPIPVHQNHTSPGKPHYHQYAIPVIRNPQRENDAKMSPSKACVSGISSRYLVSFAEQSYSLPAQVHSQHKDSNSPSHLEGRVKQEGMDGQTSCSCQGHESSKGLSLTQTRGLHPPVSPAKSLLHPCQQRHFDAGKTMETVMVQKPDGGDQCHLNKHSCCHLQQNSVSGLSRNVAFSTISDPMDFHFTELQSTDTETESLHFEMSETPAIYYRLPPAAAAEDMHKQFHLVQPRGNYEGIQEQQFQAMANVTSLVQPSNEQRHTESQISDKEDFDNKAYLPDEAELFPASGDVDERAFPYPVQQKFQEESGAISTADRPQSPLSKAIADFLASEKLKSGLKQSQSKTSGIKSCSAGQPAHSNEQDMNNIDTTCLANTGNAPVHHRTIETKESSSRHRGVLAEGHETAIVPVKDNGHQSAHLPELRLAPLIDPSFQTLSGTMKSKLSNTTNNALKKFAENREELLHKYGLNSEFVAKVTCEQKENMGLQQSRSSSRDRILPLSFKLKKVEMPNNQKVEDVLCTVIGQTSSRLSEILQQSQQESAREHNRHGFSLKTEDKPLPDALTKTISDTTETISLELDRLLRKCQTEHVAKKSPSQMDEEASCKANRYAEELRDEAHQELDQEQHFEINPSHCVELKDKIETSDIESSSDFSQTEDDIAKDDSVISNEDSLSEHKDCVSEHKQSANNAVNEEKMNDEKESSGAATAENTSIQENSRSGSKDPDNKAHKTTRCNRSRSKESSEPRQSSPCVLKHYEEEYMKAIRKMHGKMKRSGSSDICIRTHSNNVSDSGSCMRSYNERDYSSHRSRKRKRHDSQSSKDEYKRIKRYERTRSVSPCNRKNEHHSRDSSRESDNIYHRKRKHHSTRSLSPVYGKSRGTSLESVSKSHKDDGYCSSDDHSAKRQSRRYARGSSAGDNRDIDKSCSAKQSSVKSGSPEYVNSEHTPVNQTTECDRKIEYTVIRSESSESPASREKTFNSSRNGIEKSSSPQCQNSRSFSIDKDARLKVSIVNDRVTDANTDDSDKIYHSSSASVDFGKVKKQQSEPDHSSRRSASPDCKRGRSGSDQDVGPSILSDYSRCKSQDSDRQYQSRPIDQDTSIINQDTHEGPCASKGQSVTSQRDEEDKRATSPGLESFGSSCHPPITLKDFDEENDQSKQGVNGGYKIDRLSPDQDSRHCEDKDLHTRNCSEDTASSINQGAYLEGTLDFDRTRCSNQESVNSSLYSTWSTADSDLNKTVTSNFDNTTLSDLNSTNICSTDVQLARSVSPECKAKGCLDQDPTSCTSIDHDTARIRSPELTKRDHIDDKENSMRAWTSSDFRPQGTIEHPGVKTPTLESEHEQRSANSSSIKLDVDVYKTHDVVKSENAENLASLPFEKVYCDTSVTVSSKNHGKNSADFESRNGTCEKMSPSYTQTKNGHKETQKTCERSQSESLVITVRQKESVDYPNLEVSAMSSPLERDYLSCARKDTLMLLDSRRGACKGSLPSENEKSLSKISGETIEKESQKLQLKMEDDFVRKISVIEFDTKYSESEMHQSTNNEYRAGMPKVRVTISNDKNTRLPDVSSGKTCDELCDKWKAIPSIIGPEVASVEPREASKDVLNKFKPVVGRPDTVDVSLPCLKEPIPFATNGGNKDGRRPKTLEDASVTQIREASVQHSMKESQSTWKPVAETTVSPVQHSVKESQLKWKPVVDTFFSPVQHSVKESQLKWKPVETSAASVQHGVKESQSTWKQVVEAFVSPIQHSVKESQSTWKPVFETSVPPAQECLKESQSPWKPAAETFATYDPSCVLQMATDGKNVLTTTQRKRRKFSEEKITSQVSSEEQEKKIPERSSTPDTFWKKKIGHKRSHFEESKNTISGINAASPSSKLEDVHPTSGASSSSVGDKDRINITGFVKEQFKMKPSFIPTACRIQRAKPVFNKNIDLWSKWRMKPNNNADSGASVKTNDQQTSSSFHSHAEDLNLQKFLPAERDPAHIAPESSQDSACMPGKTTVNRLNTQHVPSLPTQKTASKWKPIPESTEPSTGSTTLKTSVDSCGARVCQNPNPRTTPGSSKTEEDTQFKFYVFNPRKDLVCERVKGVMRTTYRSEINPLYMNFSDDYLSNLDLVILVRECDVLRIKTIPHIQQLLKRSKVRIMKFTEFQNVMKGDVKDITNIVNMVI